MKNFSKLLFVAAVLAVTWSGVAQATVISVDIQSNVAGNFVTMAGVESRAATADSDFNVASTWNIADLAGGSNVNPSWTNLVDSTGAATGVGFSITGTVAPTGVIGNGESALNEDSLRFADGSALSATLSWQISGLTAGSSYKLYLNQLDVTTWLGSPQNRAMSGLIDTDGDGTPNGAYTMNFPGVLVTGTVAGDGIIRGTSVRTTPGNFTTEPDWAGWQLSTTVPEPTTLCLVTLSLLGLTMVHRRRNRP